MGSCSQSHMTLWSCSLMKSSDSLKSLYFQYQCLWPPNLSSFWLARRGFVPCYSTLLPRMLGKSCEKLKLIISSTTTSMVTKLGRMVACFDCLLSIKSNDHVITWFCKIMWQIKNISLLPKHLWLQNLTGWGFTLSGFYP